MRSTTAPSTGPTSPPHGGWMQPWRSTSCWTEPRPAGTSPRTSRSGSAATTSTRRDPMANHTVGSQDQWLAARKELLVAEKEHMRQGDELARRRRELPWVPVEKEYSFETGEGTKSLADLFDRRSQLLVYHFMFGFGYRVDDENPGCTGCSFV